MHYYAQIDGDGICTAVSSLSGAVDDDNMIPLDYADYSLVGKRFRDGEWLAGEPKQEPPLTEQEQMMVDIYLNTEYLVIIGELGI